MARPRAQGPKGGVSVNIYGIIFMAVSWGFITGLLVFCFYGIFRKKRVK